MDGTINVLFYVDFGMGETPSIPDTWAERVEASPTGEREV